LIPIAGETHAIDVLGGAAHRRIVGERLAQHDHVVIVPKRRLSAVQRRRVTIDPAASALQQPQHVPQRLHRLAPFVEVGGTLSLSRARQRFASAPVRAPDAGRERAEPAVSLAPLPGRLSKPAKIAVDFLPRALAAGMRHRRAFFRGEPPAHARDGVLARQLWGSRLQLVEDFDHRVPIAQIRERAIDSADCPAGPSQTAAAIRVDQLQDRARLLEALPRLVNRLVGRTLRATEPGARVFQFFCGETAEAAPDGFVRFQPECHQCLIILFKMNGFIAQFAPRARPLHPRQRGRVMTDLMKLPAFADQNTINVVVESPRGSTLKLKYDAKQRVMTLSRPLVLGLQYPYDWGFVPSTRGPDGDPVDAFVMWEGSTYPGILLPCRPIGVLYVEQTNPERGVRERNDRLALLPGKAPRMDGLRSVFDFHERVRTELERFFFDAVAFEGKELKILGWGGAGDATALVRASRIDRQPAHA
jgi:inorganic pyrophosphatase